MGSPTRSSSPSHWFPSGTCTRDVGIYGNLSQFISLVCGGMGGLVVGNRMAFFSDALAHCAFAGVSLGLIFCLIADVSEDNVRQSITLIMVAFSIVVGAAIAWVRDHTGLASDTVIGVFFAFSLGIGAIFTKIFAQRRRLFNIESFMFGSLTGVQALDIVLLGGAPGDHLRVSLLVLQRHGARQRQRQPGDVAGVPVRLLRTRSSSCSAS